MINDLGDSAERSYLLPPAGGDPSTTSAGTTPGSFASRPRIAPGREGRWTFSSPDTPGMPQPSQQTAWDFMPHDWRRDDAGRWHAPKGFAKKWLDSLGKFRPKSPGTRIIHGSTKRIPQ